MRKTAPNDSRLAKWVFKFLAFIPTISAQKKIILENRIADLQLRAYMLEQHVNVIQEGYYDLVDASAPTLNLRVSSSVDEEACSDSTVCRIDAQFDPLRYNVMFPSVIFKHVPEEVRTALQDASKRVAEKASEQYADTIFDVVSKKYGIANANHN